MLGAARVAWTQTRDTRVPTCLPARTHAHARARARTRAHARVHACGRCSKVHAVNCLPDPGALNYWLKKLVLPTCVVCLLVAAVVGIAYSLVGAILNAVRSSNLDPRPPELMHVISVICSGSFCYCSCGSRLFYAVFPVVVNLGVP